MSLASSQNLLQLTAVSTAFPKHRSVGDAPDTTKMKRDVTETIKDSDLVHWMAGGIEINLNDDTQRNVPICWQAQLYGFTEVSNRGQFSKLLRDTFKKTRKVTRHFGSTRPTLPFPHGSMKAFGLPRKEARGRDRHLGRGRLHHQPLNECSDAGRSAPTRQPTPCPNGRRAE